VDPARGPLLHECPVEGQASLTKWNGDRVWRVRKRVRRHLTGARSDIIANRQLDVWEVAFVDAWPLPGATICANEGGGDISYPSVPQPKAADERDVAASNRKPCHSAYEDPKELEAN
jgi:hypothetical protein